MLTDRLRNFYYRLPQALQRAILVKRSERTWTAAGIVFVHIPKAAGTSISELLYGGFVGHVHRHDIERWGSARVKALPSFAVTRNPWDRLVSAYRFGRRLHNEDWRKVRAPSVIRAQVPNVESFERFVTDWLAVRDVTTLNPIFQPQSLFICDSAGDIIVDHVGRIEEMKPTCEFLRRHLRVAVSIQHANASGQPVDYRKFYKPELAELVGQIYADDVRLFRYSFDKADSLSAAQAGVAQSWSAGK